MRQPALKPITVQHRMENVGGQSIIRPISPEPHVVPSEQSERDRRKQVIAAGSAGLLIVSLAGGSLVFFSRDHAGSEPAATTTREAQTGGVPSIISTGTPEGTPATSGFAAVSGRDDNQPAESPEVDDPTPTADTTTPTRDDVPEINDIGEPSDEPVDDELEEEMGEDDSYGSQPEDIASDDDDYGFFESPDDQAAEDLDDYGFIEIPDDLATEDLDDFGFTDPVDDADNEEAGDDGYTAPEQPTDADTGNPVEPDDPGHQDVPQATEPEDTAENPVPTPESQPSPTPTTPAVAAVEPTPSPPAVTETEEPHPAPANDDVETDDPEPTPPAIEPAVPAPQDTTETPPEDKQPTPAAADRAVAQRSDDQSTRAESSGGIFDVLSSDAGPFGIQLGVEKAQLIVEFEVAESILEAGDNDEPINWIIRLWNESGPATEIYSLHITRISDEWSVTVLEVDEPATAETEIDSAPKETTDSLTFSFPLEKLPHLKIPFSWKAIVQGNDSERFWQNALADGTPGNWTETQPEERIRYPEGSTSAENR